MNPPGSAPHRVRFTGSGWEYFGVWIVNIALTICTFGLFWPWAKARRLRYLYGNTLLLDSPLGFHATGRQMLLGTLLGFALLMLLSYPANFLGPVFASLAGLVFVLATPWFAYRAMRFRMRHTSWRNLRMRFNGTPAGAYVALIVPTFFAVVVTIFSVYGLSFVDWEPLKSMRLRDLGHAPAIIASVLAIILLSVLFLPAIAWTWLRRYLIDNAVWGTLKFNSKLRVPSAAMIFAKAGLIVVLGIGAMLGTLAAVVPGFADGISRVGEIVSAAYESGTDDAGDDSAGNDSDPASPDLGGCGPGSESDGHADGADESTSDGDGSADSDDTGSDADDTGSESDATGSMGDDAPVESVPPTASGAMALLPLVMLLIYLLSFWSARAFVNGALHRLSWNAIDVGPHEFVCDLSMWRFTRVFVTNLLLTALTFGLFWPFGVIRLARLKAESVALFVQGDVESVLAAEADKVSAAGDQIADIFDVDIGI